MDSFIEMDRSCTKVS